MAATERNETNPEQNAAAPPEVPAPPEAPSALRRLVIFGGLAYAGALAAQIADQRDAFTLTRGELSSLLRLPGFSPSCEPLPLIPSSSIDAETQPQRAAAHTAPGHPRSRALPPRCTRSRCSRRSPRRPSRPRPPWSWSQSR